MQRAQSDRPWARGSEWGTNLFYAYSDQKVVQKKLPCESKFIKTYVCELNLNPSTGRAENLEEHDRKTTLRTEL